MSNTKMEKNSYLGRAVKWAMPVIAAASLNYNAHAGDNVIAILESSPFIGGRPSEVNVQNYDLSDLKKRLRKSSKDLEKYMAHSRNEAGSDAKESFKFAGTRGLRTTAGGLVGTVSLGYGVKDLRERVTENDFKLRRNDFERGFVSAGKMVGYALGTVYSAVDTVVFDGLPNIRGNAEDVGPFTRTWINAGNVLNSAEDSAVGFANIPTVGLADNLVGSALTIKKGLGETGKHIAQGSMQTVTLNKGPTWLTLAPFEYASNVFEGEGCRNMEDYQVSFEEKGRSGSILEMVGGAAWFGYGISNMTGGDGNSTTGNDNGSGSSGGGSGGSGGLKGGSSGGLGGK